MQDEKLIFGGRLQVSGAGGGGRGTAALRSVNRAGGVLEEILELVILLLLTAAEGVPEGAVGVADPVVPAVFRAL